MSLLDYFGYCEGADGLSFRHVAVHSHFGMSNPKNGGGGLNGTIRDRNKATVLSAIRSGFSTYQDIAHETGFSMTTVRAATELLVLSKDIRRVEYTDRKGKHIRFHPDQGAQQ